MNCITASRRWVAEYARGRESIVGLNHYEVHPDMPERWKEIHRRVLAGAAEANVKPANAAKQAPAKQLHDGLSPRVVQEAAKPKAASPMRSVPAEITKDSDDCHSKGKASDA